MKLLWISGLPYQVQDEALGGINHGAQHETSWIIGHLPPPCGVEMHVACLWPGGSKRIDLSYEGAIFHLLPCPRRGRAAQFFLRDVTYYEALYRELQPDIIHGWGTEGSAGLVISKLCPQRHVLSTQGVVNAILPHARKTIRYLICALMERITIARLQNVFAENEFSAELMIRYGYKGSVYIVEHPLKAEYFQSQPSPGTGKQILFIGRISKNKGFIDCLQAFASVAPSDWHLQMIGSGEEHDEKKLYHLAAQYTLADRFHHQRRISLPDLIVLMQQSSILLLPTYIDCGPTALKEALSMGLWPICYDYAGPGAYIRQAGFGSLVRYADRQQLTHQLSKCIRQKPWLDAARRERCLRFTRSAFSPNHIWPRLLRNYQQILENSGYLPL